MERNDFSFFELLLIKEQCKKAPAADIAGMIGRRVSDVQDVVDEHALANGILTYEQQEELEKKDRKKKKEADRLQAENNKRFNAQVKLAKKQKQLEVSMRNTRAVEPVVERITVTAKKVNNARVSRQEDEAWIRQKKVNTTMQEQAQTRKRKKAEEPKFVTKVVKYSEFTVIRIDSKTVIYGKPGQKPEHAIEQYHKNRDDATKHSGFQKNLTK